MLDGQEQSTLSGLHPWDVSLGEAVIAAEDYGSGKAIGARFRESKGQTLLEVTVVKGTSLTKLAVDATDGHVVS
jgi:uncharacterized membrane protein YkoI